MAVYEINASNFEQEVLQSPKPVLLDFWAPWCGPCRMMSPVVDAAAEQYPSLKVGKVNTDENGELAMRYGIQGIPTLLFFKGGQLVHTSVGLISSTQLEALINAVLA